MTDIKTEDDGSFLLPSGKRAILAPGKGRHLRQASKLVPNPAADGVGYSYALLAQLVTINGEPIVMEEIDDMDMADVNALMAKLGKSVPASKTILDLIGAGFGFETVMEMGLSDVAFWAAKTRRRKAEDQRHWLQAIGLG